MEIICSWCASDIAPKDLCITDEMDNPFCSIKCCHEYYKMIEEIDNEKDK